MANNIEDLIGTKLVIGFPGTVVTDEVIQQFKETHAGGVIFYRINFESPQQIRKVISELEEKLQKKLLVCVDHEGGRVIMYRDGVTIFPDNLAVGHTRDVLNAARMGEIAAKELRALGTDVNFAPVLDVLTKAYSPNIGIRSFGDDWRQVSQMAVAYIKALQKGGVSATAKHFPGKGHAPVDAHLKLPTINSSWAEMKATHLKPFEDAIEAGVDVIMSSHPKYPKLDPNPDNIATFSRRIMTDFLRDELKFKGVIASDDLEMGAIADMCSIDVAAIKTVAAGHDLVLSCHDYVSQKKIYYALLESYKNHQLPMPELEASVARIEALKAKRPERFTGEIGPVKEGRDLALSISKTGTVIVQDKNQFLPIKNQSIKEAAVIFPQLSSFAKKIMIESEFENEVECLQTLLSPFKINYTFNIYPIDPSDEEIKRAADAAANKEAVLFFCFDAHLYPNEKKLFDALKKSSKKLIVVFLRDPYDSEFLDDNHIALTAFGFRKCQIEAAIQKIHGQF